jgi:outer membrane protein TolC
MERVNLLRSAALATLLASLAAGRASADHALTLNDAVRMALERNEDIVISRESVTIATANVRGAQGAYDPVLQLNGGWSRSQEPVNSVFSGAPLGHLGPEFTIAEAGGGILQYLPTGGSLALTAHGLRQTTDGAAALLSPAYGTRVGVELRQPLLRDLAVDDVRLRLRVAHADRGAAMASLRRNASNTVAAVERAYWALVAVRQGLAVREDAVRLAEQQLEETMSRVQTGSVSGTELSQPRAELERRRGELLAEREAQVRAQDALKLLILTDDDAGRWLEPLAPTDSVSLAAGSVDRAGALERALSGRPELDEARAELERRRAETARARSGVWPSLDAVVSYERFGLSGTPNPATPPGAAPAGLSGDLGNAISALGDGETDAARIAVVLGLPITNRSARSAVTAARSAERQAEAALLKLRKTICAEVLDAAAALETAAQRVSAARAGREAAEIQFAAERDRFASGRSTNFLVLTRQNDLSRARLDEISARTDYESARTELALATGSLVQAHGIDVPSPTP